MAEIRILQGNTNRWIAHRIANDNAGATVQESGGVIAITAPRLEVRRPSVESVSGPLEEAVWQSFTLNVVGRVTRADSACIVVED